MKCRLSVAFVSFMSVTVAVGAASAVDDSPLACDVPHINVGETQVRQQKRRFELRNVSKDTVQITATHKACGCVNREFSKYSLAPGESSELTLDFPIRPTDLASGDFIERMLIYVNNQHDKPALVVSVGGRLVPVAYHLRDGIYIEAPPRGGEFKGQIDLYLNKARGVRIVAIETLGVLPIEASVVKTEETVTRGEEKAVLEVRGVAPKDLELPAVSRVTVKLNNDELREMSIPVTLYRKRSHEVRFSPQQVAFGVLRDGAKVKKTLVVELPKGARYAVERAEPSGEGVTVSIEEAPRTPHVVKLRCELDAAGIKRSVNQELLVTVAVPDGPPEVYKLPISGFVKPAEKGEAGGK